MQALSIILIFAGYTLIYAAVPRQGKFATDPWAGLYADAYTDTITTRPTSLQLPGAQPTTPASTPSTPSTPSPSTPGTSLAPGTVLV